jgi:hypothetical protein
VEALSGIKNEYLEVVTSPIGVRTIEQEWMHSYVSIKELQRDLLLIFQNCIKKGLCSRYEKIAQNMLDSLDDA